VASRCPHLPLCSSLDDEGSREWQRTETDGSVYGSLEFQPDLEAWGGERSTRTLPDTYHPVPSAQIAKG
jgi:hypothetical protein